MLKKEKHIFDQIIAEDDKKSKGKGIDSEKKKVHGMTGL